MQTRIAAVSLFVGLTSCVGTVPDPPLPTTDTPAGSVSIEDYPANADTWCSVPSNADSLKADVSFSWRTAHGAKGDCSESTTIPLRESANVKLRCGVTIATQFHATAGRSNNRLNPTAFHVTALARQGPRHSGRGLAVR